MFEKVLIANRGEIALRIHRACREMGIATVAVHSEADAEAMHVRLANESVCIGPAQVRQSYLNIPNIVSAAHVTGADAIHPGYGFLAENANFAEIVEEHGITFIGPSAEHIALMGDKIAAKKAARKLGLPVTPGSDGPVSDVDEAVAIAESIGYPVIIKAAGGGGGRGMKIARDTDELIGALSLARTEAQANFGNATVYLERCLLHPRHVEVQIVADKHGNVVHLFERDCSLQRKHQKVLEEAPAPGLDAATRAAIGERSAAAMRELGYHNVGTIEYLFEDGAFFFIEMNTRVQVEHPVSELVTGVDIVKQSILIAAGEKLPWTQDEITVEGHAIECRICAESAESFSPSPGRITDYHAPGGPGVRVDSALYAGYLVPPHYDSLIAKLIVHGPTREACIARLDRALEELVIGGVETTTTLHQRIIHDPAFRASTYDIHWLERFVAAEKRPGDAAA